MPIIKSAKKKLRKDKKRTLRNLSYINQIKKIFKQLKKDVKNREDLIKKYYSKIDKAVKEKVFHKNKGNRLKAKIKQIASKK